MTNLSCKPILAYLIPRIRSWHPRHRSTFLCSRPCRFLLENGSNWSLVWHHSLLKARWKPWVSCSRLYSSYSSWWPSSIRREVAKGIGHTATSQGPCVLKRDQMCVMVSSGDLRSLSCIPGHTNVLAISRLQLRYLDLLNCLIFVS